MASLLVIIPDRLSDLIAKGEVTPRYYNPGNLFEDVHILLTNDDRSDPAQAQSLVGDAKLTFHNLPAGGQKFFASTLGWRPALLRSWARPAVDLASAIKPSLIRCHGNGLNAFAALSIKRALGIPYVISLHGNPDVDYFRGRLARTWQQKLIGRAIESVEVLTVRNADMVLPVYSPIVPYLQKHGVTRYEVVFNAVGHGITPKTDYALNGPVRLLCVGRQQLDQKDPSNIIRSLRYVERARLTLIGDGELHEPLHALASSLGVGDRVVFIKRLPNSEVLDEMEKSDVFVYSSINWEISKGCIEAALTGLPIVVNDRNGNPASEISEAPFITVRDTEEGYTRAIDHLISDSRHRDDVGRNTRRHAAEKWSLNETEGRVAQIYKQIANL